MPSMSHAPINTLRHRHSAVRAALSDQHLDALVVTASANVLYLTNFTGSSGIVIITADRVEFVTDFRYVTVINEMQRQWPELVLTVVEGSYDATLVQRLAALSLPRVGIEAAHLTLARHNWIVASLSGQSGGRIALVPTEGMVERLRVRKDDYEIATLREAAKRLSAVATAVLGDVRRNDRARARSPSTCAFGKAASAARRSRRLSPAARTRPSRTPTRASED